MENQESYLLDKQKASAQQNIDLGSLSGNTLQFIKKNWWLFLIVSILALAAGYVKYLKADRIYKSKLIGETFSLGDSRITNIVENLQELIDNEDYEQLGRLLNLKVADAKKIVSLTAGTNYEIEKKIKGSSLYVDLTPGQIFFIEAQVKDTAVLPLLEKGLVNYLINNPVSKIRMNATREGLKKFVAAIDNQTAQADSIMQLVMEGKLEGDFAPGLSAEGVANAQEKRYEANRQLAVSDEITVINSFIKHRKPISPRLSISLVLYLLPANLILLLILLFKGKKN